MRTLSGACLAILMIMTVGSADRALGAGRVLHLTVEDAITPVTSRYMVEGIRAAERTQARAVIIQLDTPGGLDTSMREAAKAILGSPVPVVVWVGPGGARAASAGMFLTIAAHVAAMAPGTNIGAAHPVGIGGGMGQVDSTMASKVVNDAVAYARSIATLRGRNADWAARAVRESVSLEAEEAVRQGVCDLIAVDLLDLLQRIDGREVKTSFGVDTLHTADAEVQEYGMGFRERVLAILANPNIAYLLLLAGILGIFFELSNPGAVLPGVIGGISLILALFAFQSLPVNYAGVMLILLAVVLFIVEIKVPSHGALSIGGVLSLLLGSLMLFRTRGGTMNVSLAVIVPALVITAGFFVLAVTLAIRAQKRRPVTGVEGMIGEIGTVADDLVPEGRVVLHGEYWTASAARPLSKGTRVRVVAVNGLHLEVTAVEGGESAREG
jgi:membrane-bound serine protease (ClpP class)